jgi:integrase
MVEGRIRDLAMFNLAIDSKLRGCDVMALKVEDVAPNGYTNDRATVRQRKTGRPVKFELTDLTRQAVDDFLRGADKKPGEFSLHEPTRSWPVQDNPAIRPAPLRMDREHRSRSAHLWHGRVAGSLNERYGTLSVAIPV